MKRNSLRFFSVLLALLLMLPVLSVTASAAGLPKRSYVEDDAGALTATERSSLNEEAQSVSEKYACSVCILYTNATNGRSIEAFADDYFDNNDMGFDRTGDGIVLVVDLRQRTYHMSTCGFGIDAFTDAGLLKIEDEILPYLSAGNWSKAAGQFISTCGSLLRQARNGNPYDVGSQGYGLQRINTALLGFMGILGAFFSGLPLRKQKKALQTVQKQKNATQYIHGQNPVLTQRIDRFITSNVVRTRKADPPSSSGHSGHSGGGSSIHVSSSGHSHGGHGGRF